MRLVSRIILAIAVVLALPGCGGLTPTGSGKSPHVGDKITVVTSLTPTGLTCFEVTTKDFTDNTCNMMNPADNRARVQLEEYNSIQNTHMLLAIGKASVVSKPTGVSVTIEGQWVVIYDPRDRLAEEFLMMSVDGTNFACKAPDNFVKRVSCRLPQYWTASK